MAVPLRLNWNVDDTSWLKWSEGFKTVSLHFHISYAKQIWIASRPKAIPESASIETWYQVMEKGNDDLIIMWVVIWL